MSKDERDRPLTKRDILEHSVGMFVQNGWAHKDNKGNLVITPEGITAMQQNARVVF